jgi:hypothetical protein
MAQAVSRWPPTAEARFRPRVSPCRDLWWTKWHWDRFFPSTSVFHCQFHSTGAPLLGKGQKIIIILIVIFITGLHKKPQGCGASVASAAGPFTTKKMHFFNSLPLICMNLVYVVLVCIPYCTIWLRLSCGVSRWHFYKCVISLACWAVISFILFSPRIFTI